MTPEARSDLEDLLSRWSLTPDGAAFATPSSVLMPVRREDGAPAMLKLPQEEHERRGRLLMEWWAGDGAAAVLAREGDALLIERATGACSLAAMSRSGAAGDADAMRILCRTLRTLHRPRGSPPDGLTPLETWFEALWQGGPSRGGFFARAQREARALLVEPSEVAPLHGDLHHDNVLDFGARGWLAIDPKSLVGEPGYDYANLFCNPDMDHPDPPVATRLDRFQARLAIACQDSNLDRTRLLRWILAYTALSAIWCLDDGLSAEIDLVVGALALATLDA